jgi:hypothetical protein
MPADTAAALINKIPAAGGKSKTEVQAALFSKMSHVVLAKILNSNNMTVDTAAKILKNLKQSDPDRVTLFLGELAKINQDKATRIENKMNNTGGGGGGGNGHHHGHHHDHRHNR